jgi:21S rRNA (GM2251-2'-O)-methyltransferase
MQNHASRYAVKLSYPISFKYLQLPQHKLVRSISLNSAINKGIRKSQRNDQKRDIDKTIPPTYPKKSYREDVRSLSKKERSSLTAKRDEAAWVRDAGRGSRNVFRDRPPRPSAGRLGISASSRRNTSLVRYHDSGSAQLGRNPTDEGTASKARRSLPPRSINHDYESASERRQYFEDKKSVSRSKQDNVFRTRDSSDEPSKTSSFKSRDPISVPYTTSASEFIYGVSPVLAALRAGRRQFYKLYIYSSPDRKDPDRDKLVLNLARPLSIPIKLLKNPDELRLLDKMSRGRPHNGYVLEASPAPKLPISSLPRCALEDGGFLVHSEPQPEEDSIINGTSLFVSSPCGRTRFPLVLLLDGIQDPENLGAIIRTAYYLGVAAVGYIPRSGSSISPVAMKASAGAAEFFPILSVTSSSAEFISLSRGAGWKVYAAVAPDSVKQRPTKNRKSDRILSTLHLCDLPTLLDESPCVLVLGGEGYGIAQKTLNGVNGKVAIRGVSRPKQDGLDSLNVSVAAGLLCSAFLRTGMSSHSRRKAMKEESDEAETSGEDEPTRKALPHQEGKQEEDLSRLF